MLFSVTNIFSLSFINLSEWQTHTWWRQVSIINKNNLSIDDTNTLLYKNILLLSNWVELTSQYQSWCLLLLFEIQSFTINNIFGLLYLLTHFPCVILCSSSFRHISILQFYSVTKFLDIRTFSFLLVVPLPHCLRLERKAILYYNWLTY